MSNSLQIKVPLRYREDNARALFIRYPSLCFWYFPTIPRLKQLQSVPCWVMRHYVTIQQFYGEPDVRDGCDVPGVPEAIWLL